MCWAAVGHCTKCVSSNLWAQIVHFSIGLLGILSASGVGSLGPWFPFPISLDDVTWLLVGVPANPEPPDLAATAVLEGGEAL